MRERIPSRPEFACKFADWFSSVFQSRHILCRVFCNLADSSSVETNQEIMMFTAKNKTTQNESKKKLTLSIRWRFIISRVQSLLSRAILVPRTRRFLVTWSGNEGLWKKPLPDVRKFWHPVARVQNLQISLLMLITDFCPSPLHRGENFTSWALSREWLFWDVLKMHHFTQLGFTDNLELKEEDSNRNRLNTLLVCRTETINRQTIVWVMWVFFSIRLANKHWESNIAKIDIMREKVNLKLKGILFHVLQLLSYF